MQPIYELNSQTTIDPSVFEQIKNTTEKLLSHANNDQYTQAITLVSSLGNEYSAIIKNALSEEMADEKSLLEQLTNANDTEICYVICIWKDGGIDLPSMAFRKLLCTLNSKNSEALIFVMTKDGISARIISSTMK